MFLFSSIGGRPDRSTPGRPTPEQAGRRYYGWIILVVSTLTVMGCLGFARFGYTLILPSMQAALGLSNTQTGILATANFTGYVIMAVLAGFIASRYGPRRVIAVSMLVVGATMLHVTTGSRYSSM